jgi:hypothetical protein
MYNSETGWLGSDLVIGQVVTHEAYPVFRYCIDAADIVGLSFFFGLLLAKKCLRSVCLLGWGQLFVGNALMEWHSII